MKLSLPFLQAVLLLFLLVIFPACSQEQLDQMQNQVEEAKAAVQSNVTALPTIIPTGEIRLQLDSPMVSSIAQCRVLTLGPGRPNVVQLRTQDDSDKESFPALFFQGTTDASETAQLAGKKVQGVLFIQKENNGPVWTCAEGELVEVQFTTVKDRELSGSFVGGKVHSSEGRHSDVKGEFHAIMGDAL